MASSNTKLGRQSSTDSDSHDTSYLDTLKKKAGAVTISEDSGRGSIQGVAPSSGEEGRHHVGPKVNWDRENTLSLPVEEETNNSGNKTTIQESYVLTVPSLGDDKATKISVKERKNRPSVEVRGTGDVRNAGSGNELEDGVQYLRLSDPQALPEGNTCTLTHGHGHEVPPPDLPENVRKKGEGKTDDHDEVAGIFSVLFDDYLKGCMQAEGCYFLVLSNGILTSSSKISTDDIRKSIVRVEQRSSRREVHLEATMSQDRCITYRPGQQHEGGNFLTLKEIARGTEGFVYNAIDVRTGDTFAVKKINITHPESGRQMLHGNAISAFLTLNGCEQICRAYGVILDEADNCAYLLMEKLEGQTLKTFLDGQETMDIELAVCCVINVLRALQHIHSKKFVHNDVTARNVILVGPLDITGEEKTRFIQHFVNDTASASEIPDGPLAVMIDTTGAGKTSFIKHIVNDTASAIGLLNLLLSSPEARHSKKHIQWTPSSDDMDRYDKPTLQRLASLVKEQVLPSLDKAYTVNKLIKDLQQILLGLIGPPSGPNTIGTEANPSSSGSPCSIDSKGIPSPPNFSPEQPAEPMPRESPEELTEMQKRLKEQEKIISELQSQMKEKDEKHNQLFNRVNNSKNELKAEVKYLKAERDELKVEAQQAWTMYDEADQDKKDLNDKLEALKAEMKELQATGQNKTKTPGLRNELKGALTVTQQESNQRERERAARRCMPELPILQSYIDAAAKLFAQTLCTCLYRYFRTFSARTRFATSTAENHPFFLNTPDTLNRDRAASNRGANQNMRMNHPPRLQYERAMERRSPANESNGWRRDPIPPFPAYRGYMDMNWFPEDLNGPRHVNWIRPEPPRDYPWCRDHSFAGF